MDISQPVPEERIHIIIPACNEAATIGRVVSQAAAYGPVLVVDDGSTDATAEQARGAGATVLSLGQNHGKSTALRAGFAAALSAGAAAVLTLDADGQHDPAEIPQFLSAYSTANSDLVIGQRDFTAMPPKRAFANRSARWFLEHALGRAIPDNQCGFRIISRRLLEQAPQRGEHFELEVTHVAFAVLHGYSISWVPVATIYRADQSSHFRPIVDSWRYLVLVAKIWLQRKIGRQRGR